MTTVLELVQNAYGEMGIPEPASLLATGQEEMQAKRYLYAEARHLRNQRVFPQLKRKHSFTTTTAATYQLPEDFFAADGNTGWDRSNRMALGNQATDVEYNVITYGSGFNGSPYGHRIFGPDNNPASAGGQFNVIPTPAAGVVMGFEYFTKTLFTPPFWVASQVLAVNDYRFVNGYIYKVSAITTGNVGTTAPSHTTGSVTISGVTWLYISAAYETIVTNSDLCLFDDDIMILGIKWRYRQAHDLEYTDILKEHNALKDKAKTRWNGSTIQALGNRGPNIFSGRLRTPYKSWSL